MTRSGAARERDIGPPSNGRRNERLKVAEKKSTEAQTVINVSGMDYTAVLVIILLLLIGVVMVFCAGYYKSAISKLYNNDMYYFLKQQGLFAIAGFCIAMIMASINYRILLRFATPLYLAANVLLFIVFVAGIASHGQRRWILIPIVNIQFQPSELSKVAIILHISAVIYRNKNILKKWPGFLFVGGMVGLTFGLVLTGGLSTALIVAIIGVGIIFIACPYVWRFVIAAAGGGAALYAYVAFFSTNYHSERFDAWLRPWDDPLVTGYQTIQSLFAIASGGLFGLGIGQSRQKSFLPEAHNDYIFSIICEELGLVGAAVVLFLFGVLIWRGIRIAMKAPDLFGSLIASGVVIMIASQVIINVAVVTQTIPSTGVTLPLISYGGTSILITMFLLGVMLNISRYSKDS